MATPGRSMSYHLMQCSVAYKKDMYRPPHLESVLLTGSLRMPDAHPIRLLPFRLLSVRQLT